MADEELGGIPGSRADASSQQAVSTKGFDPGREREVLERAIDRMGWPEIHAFQEECRKGQDIYEDAGGYLIRCIKALFGIRRRDPVTTYQDAARALVAKAYEESA